MAIEKLNDEELDMVTGGNRSEFVELCNTLNIEGSLDNAGLVKNWLKNHLGIESTLKMSKSKNPGNNNIYSTMVDGKPQSLSQNDVINRIKDYIAQHPDSI